MFAMNFVVAFVLLVAVALATKDVRRGGNPTKEQMKEFRSKVENIQRGASKKQEYNRRCPATLPWLLVPSVGA